MPTLAAQNATDEATLKGFGELWESVAPALEGDDDGAAAEGGGGGGLSLPSVPPAVSSAASRVQAGPLFSELSDPNSRLRHRLPMVGTLSRRFGATLLRRVATRLEEDAAQPGAPASRDRSPSAPPPPSGASPTCSSRSRWRGSEESLRTSSGC